MSAATAMIASEARLRTQPGCRPLDGDPAGRRGDRDRLHPGRPQARRLLRGLEHLQVYQPILVLFVLSMLAVQARLDVHPVPGNGRVLKRLRTTLVSLSRC